METELRRIEETVNEIVQEMEYLRTREQKLRDTNESTNERVKWFALGTMGMLVGLGAWQVVYLRAYFRSVVGVCRGRAMLTLWIDQSISYRRHQTSGRSGPDGCYRIVDHDMNWMTLHLWINTSPNALSVLDYCSIDPQSRRRYRNVGWLRPSQILGPGFRELAMSGLCKDGKLLPGS